MEWGVGGGDKRQDLEANEKEGAKDLGGKAVRETRVTTQEDSRVFSGLFEQTGCKRWRARGRSSIPTPPTPTNEAHVSTAERVAGQPGPHVAKGTLRGK